MQQTSNSLDVVDNSLSGTTVKPKPDETKPAADASIPQGDNVNAKQEEKDFRTFAKKRIDEGKPHKIGAFEFKHVNEKRQRQLMTEFGVPDADAEMVVKSLLAVVEALRIPPDNHISINMPEQKSVELSPVFQVNVEPTPITNIMPEMKAAAAPVVNVTVEPTPVTINTPRIKSTITKVKRDGANNLEGQKTAYEYEEDDK
jgi:hypothetical protein